MVQNDNTVSRARDCLAAVEAAQLNLRDEYELPTEQQRREVVAGLHQQINYGLKAAEAWALVAIAEALQPPEPMHLVKYPEAPDLSDGGAICAAASSAGFVCTLPPGHIGMHVAEVRPGDVCDTWTDKVL